LPRHRFPHLPFVLTDRAASGAPVEHAALNLGLTQINLIW
jgi:hypothetical protein